MNTKQMDLLDSHTDQGKLFFYGFLIWTSLFVVVNQRLKLKQMKKKVSDDTKNRIISILHGLFTFWMALYITLGEWPKYNQPNTQSMTFLMIVSAAYFVYDFYACFYYNLMDMGLVIHHMMSIGGYLVGIYSGFGGTSSITGLLYAEVSNFPMHMRCLLRNFDLKYTKTYELFEYAYFALYIIFRGVFTPFMVYYSIRDPMVPLGIKLCAFAIGAQSAYYIFEMKKILTRLYRHFKERQHKNIHYNWLSINPKIIELSYTRIEKKDAIF